ncbi:MAG: metal-sensing transcriptional repressor [Patescibacteria group bacterium]|jgi:DNA-binding FrmR family transcriptional regulator
MRKDIKSKAIRRLKIIEGQIRGLQKMVEDESYCVNIITQSSAVKEALSGIEDLVLENHLSTHVIEQMKNGKEDKAVAEILKVYKLAQRKK